jgi:hypothetical protein
VDGPGIILKAGGWATREVVVAFHPIHAKRFSTLERAEVQFLEYRLDVVASWPDCGRKRAAMNAISLRLQSFAAAPLS